MTLEIIAQALKLFLLFAGFALDAAKKHEDARLDDKQRRAILDAALQHAVTQMQLTTSAEKKQIDVVDNAVDDAVDKALKSASERTDKPHT